MLQLICHKELFVLKKAINIFFNNDSRAYPVYTVGETGTLYASQGQYYAATPTAAAASTGGVGYTTGGHYLVQQTVDEALITSAQQRTSPQTTAAVSCLKLIFSGLELDFIVC